MLIELENIHFSYSGHPPVFKEMSFALKPGEKVGMVGPNGSGKSTLLHLIMGLLKPSAGTIRLFGEKAETEKTFQKARMRIGLLFQNADDQLFSPTVIEDVAFGPLNMGVGTADARRRARETLEALNLTDHANRITHRLSGGEKKLVALATVLVMQPEVLLLDEPTTGLDEATYRRIVEILQQIEASCIIVSHEYDFLALTTRTVYALKEGKIDYNGDSSLLHSHYHFHPGGVVPHSHS
ncbi:MAG: ABC transporter ATP-binding protein [Deltaproteobacteria bacterium]|nr:ABC transporter ATP-binding protein [Deltaproteobacteria bacterium]